MKFDDVNRHARSTGKHAFQVQYRIFYNPFFNNSSVSQYYIFF